jgi:hypothetical protein
VGFPPFADPWSCALIGNATPVVTMCVRVTRIKSTPVACPAQHNTHSLPFPHTHTSVSWAQNQPALLPVWLAGQQVILPRVQHTTRLPGSTRQLCLQCRTAGDGQHCWVVQLSYMHTVSTTAAAANSQSPRSGAQDPIGAMSHTRSVPQCLWCREQMPLGPGSWG